MRNGEAAETREADVALVLELSLDNVENRVNSGSRVRLRQSCLFGYCGHEFILVHEATVHQIGNSVRTILDSGCDPAELFRDEATTERTVEETLRICAPVHIFQRWALEPAEIDGVSFKRGDKVSLILAAANLDPTKFTDPLTFLPGRNEAANLSFGAGIHFCIGAPLARLELNVVLPILFERLAGLKLAKTPVVKDVYHFHGLDRLDLQW